MKRTARIVGQIVAGGDIFDVEGSLVYRSAVMSKIPDSFSGELKVIDSEILSMIGQPVKLRVRKLDGQDVSIDLKAVLVESVGGIPGDAGDTSVVVGIKAMWPRV